MSARAVRGVHLVEIVIAVVMLAVVGAFTLPRFSQAAPESQRPPLKASLDTLRNAIERYCYDHVAWPGQKTDGENPAGSAAALLAQLTQYTDRDGIASPERTARFCYGPYLRDGLPDCPVAGAAGRRGVHVVQGAALPSCVPDVAAAWIYNCDTGTIVANSDAVDAGGRRHDEY
jgi:hypothetical protein